MIGTITIQPQFIQLYRFFQRLRFYQPFWYPEQNSFLSLAHYWRGVAVAVAVTVAAAVVVVVVVVVVAAAAAAVVVAAAAVVAVVVKVNTFGSSNSNS